MGPEFPTSLITFHPGAGPAQPAPPPTPHLPAFSWAPHLSREVNRRTRRHWGWCEHNRSQDPWALLVPLTTPPPGRLREVPPQRAPRAGRPVAESAEYHPLHRCGH